MRKIKFLSLIFVAALFFTSCEDLNYDTVLVDFEDVTLTDSIWNGSDGSGKFVSNDITFNNNYNAAWFVWSGFSCSAKKDVVTTGWANQYSAIAGSGATGSKQYAVVYDSASVVCAPDINGTFEARSVMLTNSVYAYYDMKNGSDYSKKFGTDDWFKVIIKGYLNNIVVGTKEFYLADFRNGKSVLINKWVKADLKSFGEIDRLSFTFASSDMGSYGMNTPAYVCIDNLQLAQLKSEK
mgnify:FL=1